GRAAMAVLRELALDSQVSVRGEPRPDFPVEPNTSAGRALWLGPDEWLVIDAREEDFPDAAAVIDVSGNRVCLELVGDDAEDVLEVERSVAASVLRLSRRETL